MKFLFSIVLLATLMVLASAIVCKKDTCSKIKCKEVDEKQCSSNGDEYTERGGVCGCCPMCIKLLSKSIIQWIIHVIN